MTKFLVTTLRRTAPVGAEHGRLLSWCSETNQWDILRTLDDPFHNVNPRGGDRGFRGIAFDATRKQYLVTEARSILVLDHTFRRIGQIHNPAFRHLHDIAISGRTAYVLSTGTDRVILIDLDSLTLTCAWHITQDTQCPGYHLLKVEQSIPPADQQNGWSLHLNALQIMPGHITISGATMGALYAVKDECLYKICSVPRGAHNVHLDEHNIVVLDTMNDRILHLDRNGTTTATAVPNPEHITNSSAAARPNFLRGMCIWPKQRQLVCGLSPTRLAFYDLEMQKISTSSAFTTDARWMVSGICPVGEI